MCSTTKRNIANCVKTLSRQKPICKITIQDIMKETCMSRQSFYYHFKDIYDVLEWIGIHDFQEKIAYEPGMDIDTWVLNLFETINENRSFYEKIVDQIPWSHIATYLRKPIQQCVTDIMENHDRTFMLIHSEEWNFGTDFFTTSICYYLMEYISMKLPYDREQILKKFGFLTLILEGVSFSAEYANLATATA